MRRIKLLGKALSRDEIGAVIELAKQAGCSAEEIEVVTRIGDPVPDCDDEIVLVLLSPATCTDPDLEQELAKTPNGGRRPICIWPPDGDVAAAPPAAASKYGYSIIPWDQGKLRSVAADDDTLCFEKPNGEPLPTVPTERNLCVEDEAQSK
jgi:hypothetical protein